MTAGHSSPRVDRVVVPVVDSSRLRLADRYWLEERIGDGSTSTVWLAWDELLARPVAVKVLSSSVGLDAARRDGLREDLRAASGLSHPGLVTVHDFGEAAAGPEGDEAAYVVMELLEGESLADRLRRGQLPWREAARICAQIASALAVVHEAGIAHKDVRPSRIFLGVDRVRLLGLGLAAALRSLPGSANRPVNAPDPLQAGAAAVPASSAGLGGEAYSAPETRRRTSWRYGAPDISSADVYALGAVLAEALSGRPVRDAPLPRSVPEDIATLRLRCLAPNPSVRPSAAEVAEILNAVLAGERRPARVQMRSSRRLERTRRRAWAAAARARSKTGGESAGAGGRPTPHDSSGSQFPPAPRVPLPRTEIPLSSAAPGSRETAEAGPRALAAPASAAGSASPEGEPPEVRPSQARRAYRALPAARAGGEARAEAEESADRAHDRPGMPEVPDVDTLAATLVALAGLSSVPLVDESDSTGPDLAEAPAPAGAYAPIAPARPIRPMIAPVPQVPPAPPASAETDGSPAPDEQGTWRTDPRAGRPVRTGTLADADPDRSGRHPSGGVRLHRALAAGLAAAAVLGITLLVVHPRALWSGSPSAAKGAMASRKAAAPQAPGPATSAPADGASPAPGRESSAPPSARPSRTAPAKRQPAPAAPPTYGANTTLFRALGTLQTFEQAVSQGVFAHEIRRDVGVDLTNVAVNLRNDIRNGRVADPRDRAWQIRGKINTRLHEPGALSFRQAFRLQQILKGITDAQ